MTAAAVPGPIPASQGTTTSARGLGRLASLLVLVVALAGVPVALKGDFAILWYPPFAAVGALLAIRRPRTSIGWLLLACGWGFALVQLRVTPTPADFASGSIGADQALIAIASAAAGPTVFVLFALIAAVFPSGRLPRGGWGAVVRLGLVVTVACLVLMHLAPTITVSAWVDGALTIVRNPIAVAPDLPIWSVLSADTLIFPIVVVMAGAAVSIFVRYRRATGVEREQLRWIAAALILVVLGVFGGFVLSAISPAAGASGLVWIGAALAFPLIPVAIGFAVLRYRLYDIDTIINRAVVYGAMTAILAGLMAAAVGLTRQLFEGLLGPGSDASLIVSTVVAVSAFEPVKKRVQAVVDGRLRPADDPAKVVATLVASLQDSPAALDTTRTMVRFLDVASHAYRATVSTIAWTGPDAGTRGHGDAAVHGIPAARVVAGAPGRTATLELWGIADPDGAATVLEPALASALEQLGPA